MRGKISMSIISVFGFFLKLELKKIFFF